MAEKFDKFTDDARKVLTFALYEATSDTFNHNYIGTEHLLLGLLRVEQGVAADVLNMMGVTLTQVRRSIGYIIGRGEGPIMGEINLTPRAKKVVELSVDEARKLGHRYIGTEHILLALIREGEGIGAGVMESLAPDLQKVRERVLQVLRTNGT